LPFLDTRSTYATKYVSLGLGRDALHLELLSKPNNFGVNYGVFSFGEKMEAEVV
jgi:hypothetical protein